MSKSPWQQDSYEAGLKKAAEIAKSHLGKAQNQRRKKRQTLSSMSPEAALEISAEERGGDIVAILIEEEILKEIPK